MARGRRSRDDEEPRVPGWVVTYGDMMSLLLTFFVLMISFSTIHEEEFEKAIASLHGAFGMLPREMTLIDLAVVVGCELFGELVELSPVQTQVMFKSR